MLVTVIDNQKKPKNNWFANILMLIIGIFLTINSASLMTTLFIVLGIITICFGIFELVLYIKNKENESSTTLVSATTSSIIGILIIIFAPFFSSIINIFTGLFLLINALMKFNQGILVFPVDKPLFIYNVIWAVIFAILGFYTVFNQNVILIFIGVVLIISSLISILDSIRQK